MTQPQSHSQAIVEFITTTESFTSPEVLARLEKADALATLLQVHLAEGNRRLGASKEYLRKVSPPPSLFFSLHLPAMTRYLIFFHRPQQQAQSLEFNGRKDKGDDFDQLMEAEEAMESGPGSGKMTGSGGGGGSKSGSLRGVSSNMADIGF